MHGLEASSGCIHRHHPAQHPGPLPVLPGGLNPFLMRHAGFCQDLQQRGYRAGLICCFPIATTSKWTVKSQGGCAPSTLLTCESSLHFSLFSVSVKASELWCPRLCQNTVVKTLQTVSLSDQSVLCYYSPARGKQPVLLELLPLVRRRGPSCGLASIAVVLGGLLCSFTEGGKLEKTPVLERSDFFLFFF